MSTPAARGRLTRVLVLVLGLLYVVAGIGETVRLVRSGDGGLVFWFGSLVGGGALVLLGEAAHRRRPGLGATLVSLGAGVGVPATIWTIVVPVSAVTVIVLAIKRYDDQTASAQPADGGPLSPPPAGPGR